MFVYLELVVMATWQVGVGSDGGQCLVVFYANHRVDVHR